MSILTTQFGEHRDLRKRVLESSRLKDTIKPMNSEGYGKIGGYKDSVDHYTVEVRLQDGERPKLLHSCRSLVVHEGQELAYSRHGQQRRRTDQ